MVKTKLILNSKNKSSSFFAPFFQNTEAKFSNEMVSFLPTVCELRSQCSPTFLNVIFLCQIVECLP